MSMQPKHSIPFYKWIIIAASVLVLTCGALALTLLLSQNKTESRAGGWSALAAPLSASPSVRIRNPDAEVRGVWIATVFNINFPSEQGLDAASLKSELDDIIATAKDIGFNTIYFQVRPSADAFYDSSYFPVSKFLTGKAGGMFPDGFDPFAYLLETAHKADIAVHAWVNPLRVTTGSADKPQHDVSALPAAHPARLNPDWTVKYADGKLYFDPGIPGVRELVAAGVREIVEKYDVDGVVFDDYFYPYPVTGGSFADDASFKAYGGTFTSRADWRRDNINQLVKVCCEAVKGADADCQFGISPFGIWQNDDGKNGGSATKGLSAYSEIYADALAWIKGGYVDYVAPQISWEFAYSAARFDVLVRWWNEQLEEYDKVKLIVSHGAYRVSEWSDPAELGQQIVYSRSLRSYTGCIMYGYAAIKANEAGAADRLREAFAEEIVYTGSPASTGAALTLTSPASGTYLNSAGTYLIGSSDPSYPLYLDGKAVGRTRSGHFSVYLTLEKGENKFLFSHKGKDTEYVIFRGTSGTSTEKTYAQLSEYKISAVYPTRSVAGTAGTAVMLSVTAPSKSTVTATLGSTVVKLSATVNPPNNGTYMSETYTGRLTIPAAAKGELKELGKIVFKAVRGSESAEAEGSSVRVIGEGAPFAARITENAAELKVATDSWYYDDYTPASAGMRDNIVSQANGYYRLRMGGYVAESASEEVYEAIPVAEVKKISMSVTRETTVFTFQANEKLPLNGYIEDGKFVLTLYNVNASAMPEVKLHGNPLFSAAEGGKGAKESSYYYKFTLKNVENFYGFSFSYLSGRFSVTFRNPMGLAKGSEPLDGKVVVLDAGHGGSDRGAAGPDGLRNEKDMNLDVTLSAAAYLRGLGAKVVLTRTDDSTVAINDRLEMLEALSPDLAISIHQNSVDYSSDITKIRGVVALYFADSGRLLADCVSEAVAGALDRCERPVTRQRLAMVRNAKFPAALVEVGFITCVEEYELMYGEAAVERAGKAVADSVVNFYAAQEKYMEY